MKVAEWLTFGLILLISAQYILRTHVSVLLVQGAPSFSPITRAAIELAERNAVTEFWFSRQFVAEGIHQHVIFALLPRRAKVDAPFRFFKSGHELDSQSCQAVDHEGEVQLVRCQ